MRALLTAATMGWLLFGAASAGATPAIAVDPGGSTSTSSPALDREPADTRTQLEAAGLLSIATLGDYSATGWGPQIAVGRRYDELSLMAYASALEIQAIEYMYGPEHPARMYRLGVGSRFSFLTLEPGPEMDFAFEVTAERRFVRWSGGGRLDRTGVLGGFVLNMDPRPNKRARRTQRIAVHYAIRMGAVQGPPRTGGLDFVSLFEVGMHWSK